MARQDLDFRAALRNPESVFGTPERVLTDPRLDREGKRAILRGWAQDERELAAAEEEGMSGGERDMLRRVLEALKKVSDAGKPSQTGMTKNGGSFPETRRNGRVRSSTPSVGQLMYPTNEIVHVDQTLREAQVRMASLRISFLPVADGDEVVGILTAHDLYSRSRTANGRLQDAMIRDHLTKQIAYCYETDNLATAKQIIEQTGRHHLLVTDEANQLVGLITLDMITAALRLHGAGRTPDRLPETSQRVTDSTGRARGSEPGKPRTYTVKPSLKD